MAHWAVLSFRTLLPWLMHSAYLLRHSAQIN